MLNQKSLSPKDFPRGGSKRLENEPVCSFSAGERVAAQAAVRRSLTDEVSSEGRMRCAMPALVFLSQGYKLELQIQSKLQQIADLRALATQVHSFSSTEPISHTRDVTAMQSTIAKIVEEEQILNAKIDALVDAKREIREVIDCVEDVTLRLILEKRHLLFQPWEEIAIDLGITSRWAKDRHKEALKAVERILEEAQG